MQSQYSPSQTRQLKNIFKWLNRWIVFVFRAGFGPFFTRQTFAGKIMVIENVGRKSGLIRQAPVNYAIASEGNAVYCLSGFGAKSQWYRNIQHNPQVNVWIGVQRIPGMAHSLENFENHLDIYRRVLINSGFAAPLFEGLNPKTAPKEIIRSMAQRSPLIRIELETAPETTQPHPADLAWIVISALFAWGLLRRMLCRNHA
ncbi:MAG: nitroreductase family deazaflavin-dependent oxidoreductase [Chloroflexi bacterium]|jgi:deazaflavin-dependent oxidoreductase (nitroreductase family)|nr:nitroreductase family deazaflavin-dependent oxidoreductase [Chloroflexota bacterium]